MRLWPLLLVLAGSHCSAVAGFILFDVAKLVATPLTAPVEFLYRAATSRPSEEHRGLVTTFDEKETPGLTEFIQKEVKKQSTFHATELQRCKDYSGEITGLPEDTAEYKHEDKLLVDSTWKNIRKKKTCYVYSGGHYNFLRLEINWKGTCHYRSEEMITIHPQTPTLISWRMLPEPGELITSVEVKIEGIRPTKVVSGYYNNPVGYCEDDAY